MEIKHKVIFLEKSNGKVNLKGKDGEVLILSDEKIKEGDWIVTQKTTDKEDGYEVVQIKSIHFIKEGEEYITAFGFDTGLKTNIKKVVKCKYFSNYHKHDVLINAEECKKIIATTDESLTVDYYDGAYNELNKQSLPRPSNEFLRKYCGLGGIEEVLVEYEYNHDNTVPYPKKVEGEMYKLKVAPDNTIMIKSIKDSWNREEVVKLIKEFHKCVCDHPSRNVNNWIEKNL